MSALYPLDTRCPNVLYTLGVEGPGGVCAVKEDEGRNG